MHKLHFAVQYLYGQGRLPSSDQVPDFRGYRSREGKTIKYVGGDAVRKSRRYNFMPDCRQRWVKINAQFVAASGHTIGYGGNHMHHRLGWVPNSVSVPGRASLPGQADWWLSVMHPATSQCHSSAHSSAHCMDDTVHAVAAAEFDVVIQQRQPKMRTPCNKNVTHQASCTTTNATNGLGHVQCDQSPA